MQILGLLDIQFDAVLVEVKTFFTFIRISCGHTVHSCVPYILRKWVREDLHFTSELKNTGIQIEFIFLEYLFT